MSTMQKDKQPKQQHSSIGESEPKSTDNNAPRSKSKQTAERGETPLKAESETESAAFGQRSEDVEALKPRPIEKAASEQNPTDKVPLSLIPVPKIKVSHRHGGISPTNLTSSLKSPSGKESGPTNITASVQKPTNMMAGFCPTVKTVSTPKQINMTVVSTKRCTRKLASGARPKVMASIRSNIAVKTAFGSSAKNGSASMRKSTNTLTTTGSRLTGNGTSGINLASSIRQDVTIKTKTGLRPKVNAYLERRYPVKMATSMSKPTILVPSRASPAYVTASVSTQTYTTASAAIFQKVVASGLKPSIMVTSILKPGEKVASETSMLESPQTPINNAMSAETANIKASGSKHTEKITSASESTQTYVATPSAILQSMVASVSSQSYTAIPSAAVLQNVAVSGLKPSIMVTSVLKSVERVATETSMLESRQTPKINVMSAEAANMKASGSKPTEKTTVCVKSAVKAEFGPRPTNQSAEASPACKAESASTKTCFATSSAILQNMAASVSTQTYTSIPPKAILHNVAPLGFKPQYCFISTSKLKPFERVASETSVLESLQTPINNAMSAETANMETSESKPTEKTVRSALEAGLGSRLTNLSSPEDSPACKAVSVSTQTYIAILENMAVGLKSSIMLKSKPKVVEWVTSEISMLESRQTPINNAMSAETANMEATGTKLAEITTSCVRSSTKAELGPRPTNIPSPEAIPTCNVSSGTITVEKTVKPTNKAASGQISKPGPQANPAYNVASGTISAEKSISGLGIKNKEISVPAESMGIPVTVPKRKDVTVSETLSKKDVALLLKPTSKVASGSKYKSRVSLPASHINKVALRLKKRLLSRNQLTENAAPGPELENTMSPVQKPSNTKNSSAESGIKASPEAIGTVEVVESSSTDKAESTLASREAKAAEKTFSKQRPTNAAYSKTDSAYKQSPAQSSKDKAASAARPTDEMGPQPTGLPASNSKLQKLGASNHESTDIKISELKRTSTAASNSRKTSSEITIKVALGSEPSNAAEPLKAGPTNNSVSVARSIGKGLGLKRTHNFTSRTRPAKNSIPGAKRRDNSVSGTIPTYIAADSGPEPVNNSASQRKLENMDVSVPSFTVITTSGVRLEDKEASETSPAMAASERMQTNTALQEPKREHTVASGLKPTKTVQIITNIEESEARSADKEVSALKSSLAASELKSTDITELRPKLTLKMISRTEFTNMVLSSLKPAEIALSEPIDVKSTEEILNLTTSRPKSTDMATSESRSSDITQTEDRHIDRVASNPKVKKTENTRSNKAKLGFKLIDKGVSVRKPTSSVKPQLIYNEKLAAGQRLTKQTAIETKQAIKTASETRPTDNSATVRKQINEAFSGPKRTDTVRSVPEPTKIRPSDKVVSEPNFTDKVISESKLTDKLASEPQLTDRAALILTSTNSAGPVTRHTDKAVSEPSTSKKTTSGPIPTEKVASERRCSKKARARSRLENKPTSVQRPTDKMVTEPNFTDKVVSEPNLTNKVVSVSVPQQSSMSASESISTDREALITTFTNSAGTAPQPTEKALLGPSTSKKAASGPRPTEKVASERRRRKNARNKAESAPKVAKKATKKRKRRFKGIVGPKSKISLVDRSKPNNVTTPRLKPATASTSDMTPIDVQESRQEDTTPVSEARFTEAASSSYPIPEDIKSSQKSAKTPESETLSECHYPNLETLRNVCYCFETLQEMCERVADEHHRLLQEEALEYRVGKQSSPTECSYEENYFPEGSPALQPSSQDATPSSSVISCAPVREKTSSESHVTSTSYAIQSSDATLATVAADANLAPPAEIVDSRGANAANSKERPEVSTKLKELSLTRRKIEAAEELYGSLTTLKNETPLDAEGQPIWRSNEHHLQFYPRVFSSRNFKLLLAIIDEAVPKGQPHEADQASIRLLLKWHHITGLVANESRLLQCETLAVQGEFLREMAKVPRLYRICMTCGDTPRANVAEHIRLLYELLDESSNYHIDYLNQVSQSLEAMAKMLSSPLGCHLGTLFPMEMCQVVQVMHLRMMHLDRFRLAHGNFRRQALVGLREVYQYMTNYPETEDDQ